MSAVDLSIEPFYDELRSHLARSFERREPFVHIGRPRIYFRLEREFGAATALLSYQFLVRFYHLSGTQVLPIHISNGCVSIEGLPERVTDFYGVDLRKKFLLDKSYHAFNSAFGVSRVHFHAFPNIIEMGNHDVVFSFKPDGAPVR